MFQILNDLTLRYSIKNYKNVEWKSTHLLNNLATRSVVEKEVNVTDRQVLYDQESAGLLTRGVSAASSMHWLMASWALIRMGTLGKKKKKKQQHYVKGVKRCSIPREGSQGRRTRSLKIYWSIQSSECSFH